jgi:hypothetical protein
MGGEDHSLIITLKAMEGWTLGCACPEPADVIE